MIFKAALSGKRRTRNNLRSVFRPKFTAQNTQISLSATRFTRFCMPTAGNIFAGLMSERSNAFCCPSVRTTWKLLELQREAVERSATKEWKLCTAARSGEACRSSPNSEGIRTFASACRAARSSLPRGLADALKPRFDWRRNSRRQQARSPMSCGFPSASKIPTILSRTLIRRLLRRQHKQILEFASLFHRTCDSRRTPWGAPTERRP